MSRPTLESVLRILIPRRNFGAPAQRAVVRSMIRADIAALRAA